MSTDLSNCSADENPIPDAAREIEEFAQSLLKGLRFHGIFVEKRYVPVINMYRSVIYISSEEKPLIRILKEVTNRINKLVGENNPFFWIGFTLKKDKYFLWVNLAEEILGEHLFNIRGFQINQTEAKVQLRQVRTKQTTPRPETTFNSIGSNFLDETIKPIVQNFVDDLGINLRSTLTFTNMKNAISFFVIILLAIASGAFYSVKYLMEFFLRLTREFSFMMKSLTPTILSLIDLIKYAILGFFGLVLVLFKSSHNVPNDQELRQGQIQFYNDYGYTGDRYLYKNRSITSGKPEMNRRRSQGVKITELDN